ncbi:unnamed protein product [Hymenolepis diminuta]|uniref:Uncharacterized protein n=1 Tax=Hymenolepis diminuta TaxID=6216 RepID=A0A564YIB6_HYMDI|nr:unnamed protein product [Hymenolepis diminuta]
MIFVLLSNSGGSYTRRSPSVRAKLTNQLNPFSRKGRSPKEVVVKIRTSRFLP